MTRKYSLIVENEGDSFSAYVPEISSILVTGSSIDELTRRASEAIRLYWETVSADRSPTSSIQEIEVEIPA